MVVALNKIDLNSELNFYKLMEYEFVKNDNLVKIDKTLNKNRFTFEDFGFEVFLLLNEFFLTVKDKAILLEEEAVQAFNMFDDKLETEWLFDFEQKKTKFDIGSKLGLGKINWNIFNDFGKSFVRFVNGITKFVTDVKWILQNPVNSLLIVTNFVFEWSSILLLVIVIVSLFASMFSGEKELEKTKKYLKNSTFLAFLFKFVLGFFINAGFN